MLDWIIQNLANIVICLVLILAVTLAVVKLVRDKKAGRSTVPWGCCGWPGGGTGGGRKQERDRRAGVGPPVFCITDLKTQMIGVWRI